MRLVLAHDHDVAARELVARWGSDALLLTPAELSSERLLLHLDEDGAAQAELASRPGITSVLTRLGGISAADLPHIDPQDAVYAAAELDAFLRAWLGVWPGPVVNRPSTTCLNGPGWRPEQWVTAATAVGLRANPVTRRATRAEIPHRPDTSPAERVTPASNTNGATPVSNASGAAPVSNASGAAPVSNMSGAAPAGNTSGGATAHPSRVTVVGGNWFGTVGEEIGFKLCGLAEAVGCSALEAILVDGVVMQVSAWPDVAEPGVADALARVLDGRP
jgi:hypothetical protein